MSHDEDFKSKETKRANVAEQQMLPGLAERIFGEFVQSDSRRGLRLIAQRKAVGVAEAEAVVQRGIREMLANGAPPPRFRTGFGKPVQRAVVSMPARKAVAA